MSEVEPKHTIDCTMLDGKCISLHCPYCGDICSMMGHSECQPTAVHKPVPELFLKYCDDPDCTTCNGSEEILRSALPIDHVTAERDAAAGKDGDDA